MASHDPNCTRAAFGHDSSSRNAGLALQMAGVRCHAEALKELTDGLEPF
jgi:hypothetical protein